MSRMNTLDGDHLILDSWLALPDRVRIAWQLSALTGRRLPRTEQLKQTWDAQPELQCSCRAWCPVEGAA